MKLISINETLLKLFFYLLPLSYCIGQAAVSFVFIFFTILFFISNKEKSFLYDDIIKCLLILYFFSLILGSFFSSNISQSLYSSVTLIRFLIFFLAINLFADIFKKKIQNRFFLWSFFLAFIVILDAYYQYLNPLKEDIFGENCLLYNSTGCLIRKPENKIIVVKDLHEYMIIDEGDILLIHPLNKEQEIKSITEDVKNLYA
jgi:hypothetical protein